ncbi:MAG: DNA-processing protein DprA [candidate division Zixibacteria bacterium]|nr:DNA-processing protein DprA [candidate division Zixibacteria bacterium]MDH3937286.1 DNA-processing protein DprA [candidate division Zixibacteria bacterium]MDH4035322.1 DNA-processing protein DprA [candidate division Zixibacteria bacterium]
MTRDHQNSSAVIMVALTKFCGFGPRMISALLQRFGEPAEILNASEDALMKIDGLTTEQADQICTAGDVIDQATEYCQSLKQRDVIISTRLDDGYPEGLYELNDPPPLLFVRGRLPDGANKSVAVVGADEATGEGIDLTVTLAQRCAEAGVQIVSSLRRGIDAAAHLGAKAGEGVSFAVLDGGLDHIDLVEQMPLAIDITRAGGVLSEFPPETEPTDKAFSVSNRVLVGLAQAVVVTEVYGNSKATLDLLTFCNETGKLAFVLIDPKNGALSDETSLSEAVRFGAIPMVGLDKIEDIIKSLV